MLATFDSNKMFFKEISFLDFVGLNNSEAFQRKLDSFYITLLFICFYSLVSDNGHFTLFSIQFQHYDTCNVAKVKCTFRRFPVNESNTSSR